MNSRINSFIENEEEKKKIKDFLFERYVDIKNTYRYYASFSGFQKTMCIASGTLNDMLNTMGAIDFKNLTLNNVAVCMAAVDTASLKYNNNPAGKLIRHEFMEFLIRAAKIKFYDSSRAGSLSEALEMFYEDYCEDFFKRKDPSKFRETLYWTDKIDFLYRIYQPLLQHIDRKSVV